MEVVDFCRQSRVLLVAGKGGVGKTTVSATIARAAAGAGLDVLLVELEGKGALAGAFGAAVPLEYDQQVLLARSPRSPGSVTARRITPDEALLEYLADHGLNRISRRLVSSGALDVVATAVPGIRDVLVLGKVKQLDRAEVADLIVVDAPATGHAISFLTSARGLFEAARSGPVRSQAAEVLAMLADARRCQVLLVTLPEEMPVNEATEAAYAIEDRVGVALGPVVVNGCLPALPGLDVDPDQAAAQVGVTLAEGQAAALAAAARFSATRRAVQRDQVTRLHELLPLPLVELPALDGEHIGPEQLEELARVLEQQLAHLPSAGTRA